MTATMPRPPRSASPLSRAAKPPRRTQEERTATTRRALIDAAVQCLSELGYLTATVEVVARRAGVSRGAVQHHFGSRNDLLIAVVDELGQSLAVLDEIPADLPIARRVDEAIDRTWEVLRSPHFIAVVQIWIATRDVPEVVSVVSRKISLFEREMDRRWQQMFAEATLPPAKIATIRHIVLATLRGLALRTLYHRKAGSGTEEVAMLKSMVTDTLT